MVNIRTTGKPALQGRKDSHYREHAKLRRASKPYEWKGQNISVNDPKLSLPNDESIPISHPRWQRKFMRHASSYLELADIAYNSSTFSFSEQGKLPSLSSLRLPNSTGDLVRDAWRVYWNESPKRDRYTDETIAVLNREAFRALSSYQPQRQTNIHVHEDYPRNVLRRTSNVSWDESFLSFSDSDSEISDSGSSSSSSILSDDSDVPPSYHTNLPAGHLSSDDELDSISISSSQSFLELMTPAPVHPPRVSLADILAQDLSTSPSSSSSDDDQGSDSDSPLPSRGYSPQFITSPISISSAISPSSQPLPQEVTDLIPPYSSSQPILLRKLSPPRNQPQLQSLPQSLPSKLPSPPHSQSHSLHTSFTKLPTKPKPLPLPPIITTSPIYKSQSQPNPKSKFNSQSKNKYEEAAYTTYTPRQRELFGPFLDNPFAPSKTMKEMDDAYVMRHIPTCPLRLPPGIKRVRAGRKEKEVKEPGLKSRFSD